MFIRTIYYVNVGNMSPTAAKAHIADIKAGLVPTHTDADRPVFVGVRNEAGNSWTERHFVPESHYDAELILTNAADVI